MIHFNFFIWCKVWVTVFFAYDYLIAPTLFVVEKTILSPLTCLLISVKNQLAIHMWVSFCTLCSVPLVYLVANITLLQLLWLYKLSLEANYSRSFNFFAFKIVLAILGHLYFHGNFKISLSLSTQMPSSIMIALALH